MPDTRRDFLKMAFAGAALPGGLVRKIPLALVQFDAVPEQIDRNLDEVREGRALGDVP
jgi:hypothetical protein